jgi:hypothetical protein
VSSLSFSADTASTTDFPYRVLSRLSVFSVVLILIAVFGLLPGFEPVLAAALVGAVLGFFAIRQVTKYPNEYAGIELGIAGLVLNLLILAGGLTFHIYTYLTEVPDGYERKNFASFEAPKEVADVPTPDAVASHGKQIFLKGYVHPSSGDGRLRKFVLIPDLGTCCFGGDPRSTSMIEVTLTGANTISYQMKKFKLAGTFEVDPYARPIHGFQNVVYYRMRVDQIR